MSEQNNGFICPECRCNFENPDELSNHFETSHSKNQQSNIMSTDDIKNQISESYSAEKYEERILRQKEHMKKQNEVIKELRYMVQEMKALNESNEKRISSNQEIMREEIKNMNSLITTMKIENSALNNEKEKLIDIIKVLKKEHLNLNMDNKRYCMLELNEKNSYNSEENNNIYFKEIDDSSLDNYTYTNTSFDHIRKNIFLTKTLMKENISEIKMLIKNIKLNCKNKFEALESESKEIIDKIKNLEDINNNLKDENKDLKSQLDIITELESINKANVEKNQKLNEINIDLTETIKNLRESTDEKINYQNKEKYRLSEEILVLRDKINNLENIIFIKNTKIDEFKVENKKLQNIYTLDYISKTEVENIIQKIKNEYELKLKENINNIAKIEEDSRLLTVKFDRLNIEKSDLERSYRETVKILDTVSNDNNIKKKEIFEKENSIIDLKNQLKNMEEKIRDNLLALCELGAQNQKLQV